MLQMVELAVTVPDSDDAANDMSVVQWHCEPDEEDRKGSKIIELQAGNKVIFVCSPVTGVLLETFVQEGDIVSPSDHIATMEDITVTNKDDYNEEMNNDDDF